MIRIVVADDHTLVREGLCLLLDMESDFTVVGEARTGREAISLSREHKPDVVIMDIAMPDLNGVEATRRIVAEVGGVRVVGLSMHSNRRYVENMLSAGAAGYVLKNCAFREIQTAVRAVVSGQGYLSPEIAGLVISDLVCQPVPSGTRKSPHLTEREKEILQLIAEGYTSKEIASRLNLSVRTVENHRRKIMKRLGLHSVASLTKYAVKEGLTDLEF